MFFLVSASPNLSSADVISWSNEGYQDGTRLLYETVTGAIQTRRIVRDADGTLQVQFLSSNKNRIVSSTLVVDEHGRVKERRYSKSRVEKFVPHSCVRVIGECEYEFTNVLGDIHKRFYNGELTKEGGLSFSIMNEHGTVLSQVAAEYAPDGLLKSMRKEKKNDSYSLQLIAIVAPDGTVRTPE